MSGQADKVSHASLNGIYVKAQELDRGHSAEAAPDFAPPGSLQADADSHASTHASDAQTHASDTADVKSHANTHASDAETAVGARASDAGSHATSHATE